MQLVILHHHLNRGGVTSVIENHLRSLATLCESERPSHVTICYGGRDAAWQRNLPDELPFECSLAVIPELEYDNFRTSPASLYDALLRELASFDRASTVLHFHNHSLGKNAELAPTVCRLADEGWRLLLQIHDYSEDLRPSNYRHLLEKADSREGMQSELYPQAEQIQYTVLNQRDRQVLADAGVSSGQLHLLANPVRIPDALPDFERGATSKIQLARDLEFPASNRFVLYPVRPIRRKNLGEFLLWSLLASETVFGLTLAPLNPQEQSVYQRWVDFAAQLGLPVRFEIASKTDLAFEDVYSAADAIITTSVAEGFGMVYLEASLARKQLVGRNLPSVCYDFESAGMRFPQLSEVLSIPTKEIDVQALQRTHNGHIERLRADYGLHQIQAEDHDGAEALFSGDTLDYARLESGQQKEFLKRVKTDASLRESLCELNPTVSSLSAADSTTRTETLESNCRVISENYSPQVIGRQLSGVYRSLIACQPGRVTRNPEIAQSVLSSFVHARHLFPLRLES